MKYIILQGDGMADYPLDVLGGRTPLEAARTPNMDWLAARGVFGLAHVIPEGFPPGSDVGNMSIMGYDPALYHTGRSPLEAASMGVALGPEDIAFRCNLVTLAGAGRDALMEDFTSGHITTAEAAEIMRDIGRALGGDGSRVFSRRELPPPDGLARRQRENGDHAAARYYRPSNSELLAPR
jgi:2,3-bisphosphoglycerate-independent phosphoglycerate mutase